VPASSPLKRLPDGTVKQRGPLTGTEVWTVPGRGARPIAATRSEPRELAPGESRRLCAFCEDRMIETTPEKVRFVRTGGDTTSSDPSIDAVTYEALRRVPISASADTVAEFRRFGNLFEIVSAEYWRENYGFRQPADIVRWAGDYLASTAGREHIVALLAVREAASGGVPGIEEGALDLMGGSHDVIVARRHVRDDAETDADLVSSGDLTPEEHDAYLRFTVASLTEIAAAQPHAKYVAVFQNWLRPAGASFEHLHKQLVAIDEYGPQVSREIGMLASDRALYQREIADLAVREGLLVAANEHAVAFAGVGHRYPAFEVYSRSRAHLPQAHAPEELRGVSDLLHALHAATGTHVATNEEWHYRPPGVHAPMPWRIVLKWRISTPAGFEGGTKVYVNTIDPWTLRDRAVNALRTLRDAGRIGDGIRIGEECTPRDAVLHYAG
jgi:galactose-1-phosphate uridylyltransferase